MEFSILHDIAFFPQELREIDRFSSFRVSDPENLMTVVPLIYLETLLHYGHLQEHYDYFSYLSECLLSDLEAPRYVQFNAVLSEIIRTRNHSGLSILLQSASFLQILKDLALKMQDLFAEDYLGHPVYDTLAKGLSFNLHLVRMNDREELIVNDYFPQAPEIYLYETSTCYLFLFPKASDYKNVWNNDKISDEEFMNGLYPDVPPELIRQSLSNPEEFVSLVEDLEEAKEEMTIEKARQSIRPVSIKKKVRNESFLESLQNEPEMDSETYRMLFNKNESEKQTYHYLCRMATQNRTAGNFEDAKKLRRMAQDAKRCADQTYDLIQFQMFKRRNPNILDSDKIDLHGLRFPDAMKALREFLFHIAPSQFNMVEVVTGRGLHSVRGVAVLKNGTRDFLKRERFEYQELRGGFYVNLRRNR